MRRHLCAGHRARSPASGEVGRNGRSATSSGPRYVAEPLFRDWGADGFPVRWTLRFGTTLVRCGSRGPRGAGVCWWWTAGSPGRRWWAAPAALAQQNGGPASW
jgi:hypothetical protein